MSFDVLPKIPKMYWFGIWLCLVQTFRLLSGVRLSGLKKDVSQKAKGAKEQNRETIKKDRIEKEEKLLHLRGGKKPSILFDFQNIVRVNDVRVNDARLQRLDAIRRAGR